MTCVCADRAHPETLIRAFHISAERPRDSRQHQTTRDARVDGPTPGPYPAVAPPDIGKRSETRVPSRSSGVPSTSRKRSLTSLSRAFSSATVSASASISMPTAGQHQVPELRARAHRNRYRRRARSGQIRQQFVLENLETQRSCGMKTGAKAGPSASLTMRASSGAAASGGKQQQTSDLDGSRRKNPHRAVVSADSRRHRYAIDTKRFRQRL